MKIFDQQAQRQRPVFSINYALEVVALLYPYKTVPIFKDNIWGGHNLRRLGKNAPLARIGESWELSTLPGNENLVANGSEQGQSLKTLVTRYGRFMLGQTLDGTLIERRDVPFLLKFIDANDNLSIQVHPDDKYAALHENGKSGKTEMWYVLDAKPGAYVIHGLKANYSVQELQSAVKKKRLLEIVRKVPVKKGDVVFIPAGTIHALTEGIVVAEIQQHSDLTYRLYDYDRVDDQGRRRPLHIRQALDVLSYKNKKPLYKGLITEDEDAWRVRHLALSRYFGVCELQVCDAHLEVETGGKFHAFMVLEGEALFSANGESVSARNLETVVLPAGLNKCRVEGTFTALVVFTPGKYDYQLKPLLQSGHSLNDIYQHVAGTPELAKTWGQPMAVPDEKISI